MDNFDLYMLLFSDCFISALIPFESEIVLDSMLAFGGYAPYLMLIFSTSGGVLGAFTLFFIARFCWSFVPSGSLSGKVDNLRINIQNFGYWALLFSWVDLFGALLVFFISIAKIRLKTAFTVIFLGRILFYYFAIFL